MLFFFTVVLILAFHLFGFLDRPWSQLSPLLPGDTCLRFFGGAEGLAFPLIVDARRFFLGGWLVNCRCCASSCGRRRFSCVLSDMIPGVRRYSILVSSDAFDVCCLMFDV